MGLGIKDMSSFIVLAFMLGQFIALFNWTNLGSALAVGGASGLESIGLTGFPAILGFIVLCSVLNLFIVSGSSMWTLVGAVFVPLFALLGYEPGFIQAAFRVGDSATQVITPMNPYIFDLPGDAQALRARRRPRHRDLADAAVRGAVLGGLAARAVGLLLRRLDVGPGVGIRLD